MALVLTAAPAAEPISLAEANLRIDANDEDALLNALIAAARISVRAIEVTGLAELRRRLEVASAPESFKKALREEAEAIAAEARREAPGELARTIEVQDVSQGETLAFTVGTSDPAGRAAEFGTLKRPATLWLWPIFKAHLPAIKDRLRKLALAPL